MIQIIKEQQKQPSFGQLFAQGLSKGLSGDAPNALVNQLVSGLQGREQRQQKNKQQIDPRKIKDALMGQGVPEDKANLVAMAPRGAQSAFIKQLFQQQEPEYGSSGYEDKYSEAEPPGSANLQEYLMKDDPSGVNLGSFFEPEYQEKENDYYDDIKSLIDNRNKGLTAKDASIADKDRYDKNLPLYEEYDRHREELEKNSNRYGIMNSLSGKLPKGIGRLNVNSDGDLRAPFLAGANAERFVKTLNEFAKGAKQTFGSRVTNFDLEQYMKTFPGLLNSEEGIKQILKQMKIVNDIDKVYYNNLETVLDKAGGIRNIDWDVAKRYARKISAPKVNSLIKKFDEIGKMHTLPEASQFKGRKIKDEKTGEILTSNGQEWVPA